MLKQFSLSPFLHPLLHIARRQDLGQDFALISSRAFSTTSSLAPTRLPPAVYHLTVPPQFASNILVHYEGELKKIDSVADTVFYKPTKGPHIEAQKPAWRKLMIDFPEFEKQIQQAKNSEVIVLEGIKIPEIDAQKIPTSRVAEGEIYKNPEIKIAEIVSGLIMSQFVKFEKGQAFNLIYPTAEAKGYASRFDSDGKLLWHNDGWLDGPDEVVALCAIKGNQSVITKVITAQQIEEYFKTHGKEDLLLELAKDFKIKDYGDDFVINYGPILKDGKLRYASYGNIITESKKEKEALSFFQQALDKIEPALSISLQNGQALIIRNQNALHARDTKDGESIKPQTRLLLRANAEEFVAQNIVENQDKSRSS